MNKLYQYQERIYKRIENTFYGLIYVKVLSRLDLRQLDLSMYLRVVSLADVKTPKKQRAGPKGSSFEFFDEMALAELKIFLRGYGATRELVQLFSHFSRLTVFFEQFLFLDFFSHN